MRFRSVVFDADSTLAGIEGVDWLAGTRGADVLRDVAELTRRAMEGDVPLEEVYALRLARIAPIRKELEALGRAYVEAAAKGAREAIAALTAAGTQVHVVSGGIRRALLPLAAHLGVPGAHVHAVPLLLDGDGCYVGVGASPLSGSGGKAVVVASLGLERPAAAVGDGITDLEMRPWVDAFVAFTGFARRAAVVAGADHEATDFAGLLAWMSGWAEADHRTRL